MQVNGIVLEIMVRDVFHVESGRVLKSLTAVTLYQRPRPVFVLTREILMPNATSATVSYMVIPGHTLKECCKSLEQMSLMILNPVRN